MHWEREGKGSTTKKKDYKYVYISCNGVTKRRNGISTKGRKCACTACTVPTRKI